MNNKNNLNMLPPQAIDIEELLLGAILLEGDNAYNETKLKIESKNEFYKPIHQIIFDAIEKVAKDRNAIDSMTVIQKLRELQLIDEVGGALKIMNLANLVGSAANIKTHARIIKQLYIRREMISINYEYTKKLYSGEEDIVTIRDEMDDKVSELFLTTNQALSAKRAIDETIKNTEDIMLSKVSPRKLTHTVFDEIFNFSKDHLLWLGALEKAGKTKTTVYLMSNLLKNNDDVSVRWFSMEDPVDKIWAHFGAIESHVDIGKILGEKNEKLTLEEFESFKKGIRLYEDIDLDITYGSYPIAKLTTEAKQFVKKRKNKLNIIIVDNFNILRGLAKGKDNNEKEDYVATKLQDLKIETNKNGYQSLIYVVDHLNKNAGTYENGFRATRADLTGSSRKGQVLTQLISINKPSSSKELQQEENLKGKIVINNKSYNRIDLFNKLVLYESLTSRNASTNIEPLRMMANLGTMEFMEFNDFVGNVKSVKEAEIIKEVNNDFIIEEIPEGEVDINPFEINDVNEIIPEIENKNEVNIEIKLSNDGDELPF